MARVKERINSSGRQRVKEIIGRVSYSLSGFWGRFRALKTYDQTRPDYAWWDKFRRGEIRGFEFACLFAKPITEIIAGYVLGKGISAMLADGAEDDNPDDPRNYTDALLSRFTRRIRGLLLTLIVDLYGLGDQYIIVNPDSSLSVVSPDSVEVEHDELDYRKAVKYTITTKLDKATISDEYRLDGRTLTIKYADTRAPQIFEYANLIGRLPIVHFANDRSGNELFGRVIYAALFRLFSRYDDLFTRALDGAEMASNPVPVFEGLEDIDETVTANQTQDAEEYQDGDGNIIQRVKLAFDRMAVVLLGKGGSFRFASPQQGFTNDVKQMLKLMYLLGGVDHSRIPEILWGTEMASGRNTGSEQMDSFFMFITGRRLMLEGEGADDLLMAEAEGGLLELFDIWLRTRALTDSKVVVAPVTVSWPKLRVALGETDQKWAQFGYEAGIMTGETYVEASDLTDDPAGEVARAEAEAQARKEANQDTTEAKIDKAINDLLSNQDDDTEDVEDVEPEVEAA